jgi:hypothetical protein
LLHHEQDQQVQEHLHTPAHSGALHI